MARRIFVGNLPPDVKRSEVEHLMEKYGRVMYVDLKSTRPDRGPPFAFVEFEDTRDAEDAIAGRNEQNFRGCSLRVEFCRGGGSRVGERRSPPPPGLGIGRGPPTRRSHFRVRVTGLPLSVSWQDLKDHFRMAGDVCFAEVHRDGTGVVEFPHFEDMKNAVRKLDDSKIQSHEGHSGRIFVEEEPPSVGRARSPSRRRSRTRSRSRSYSPAQRRRSRSRSYSPAPTRKREKFYSSRNRSRSRSYSR